MTDKTEAPKAPAPAKSPGKAVVLSNVSKRPITLIADRDTRVTILPTQPQVVSGEFMEKIRANTAAMTFFESGELVESK